MKTGAYQCNRHTLKGNICQNRAKNRESGIGPLSGTVMFFCEFNLEFQRFVNWLDFTLNTGSPSVTFSLGPPEVEASVHCQ